MNRDRRKALSALAEKISGHVSDMEILRDDLIDLRDEEQEYLDNMPESMTEGERAQAAEAAIAAMDEAIGYVEDFVDSGVTAKIEEAAE